MTEISSFCDEVKNRVKLSLGFVRVILPSY